LAAERGAGGAAAFFLGSTMNSSSLSLSLPLPLLLLPEDITTLDLLSASLFAGLGAGFFFSGCFSVFDAGFFCADFFTTGSSSLRRGRGSCERHARGS
jgi:hypothetical protein